MAQVQWFPGHMKKALKEMEEKVKLVDVIIEIIDSRVPFSSKNHVLENFKQIHNKKRIIVFTKIDISDNTERKKWMNYFVKKGILVVEYDLKKPNNFNSLYKIIEQECKDKIEKTKSKGIKNYKINAMVIGVPNVGKSTFINAVAGKKSASVANKPGHTKAQQWINANEKIALLDTPGVMAPKLNPINAYNLAIIGSIRREILPLDDICFYALKRLKKMYPKFIENRYGIDIESETDEIENDEVLTFLDKLCAKRGYILKKQPDYDRAMNAILTDLQDGKFGPVCLDAFDDIEGN